MRFARFPWLQLQLHHTKNQFSLQLDFFQMKLDTSSWRVKGDFTVSFPYLLCAGTQAPHLGRIDGIKWGLFGVTCNMKSDGVYVFISFFQHESKITSRLSEVCQFPQFFLNTTLMSNFEVNKIIINCYFSVNWQRNNPYFFLNLLSLD